VVGTKWPSPIVRRGKENSNCRAGPGVVALEKRGEFLEEEFPGGFFREEDVIGGGERSELGARNFSGEDAAFFGQGDAVAIGVKNDSGNGDGREKSADVDIVAGTHGLDEIFRRDGDDLEIREPALVFVGGLFRNVDIGDDLEERNEIVLVPNRRMPEASAMSEAECPEAR
jgi:hypothetical protein